MPRLSDLIGGGGVLPSELIYFTESKQWVTPSDGWVRAMIISGGGINGTTFGTSTGGGGGGASAIAVLRWRKILQGQVLGIIIGAAGTANVNNGNGGVSFLNTPWGYCSAAPGEHGENGTAENYGLGGAGGIAGDGADYYLPGGNGGLGAGGSHYTTGNMGTINPYGTGPIGPMATVQLTGVFGLNSQTAFTYGNGAGTKDDSTVYAARPGFAAIEFCAAF